MLKLTQLREQRGWTRMELGRRARVHPATVGKIENGRQLPYPPELARLARALGVPAAEAEGLTEEVNPREIVH